MRIVITGASGNVGSALLRRLAEDGGHDLVGVVRRPPEEVGPFAGVEWASVDLSTDDDRDALAAVLRTVEASPDRLEEMRRRAAAWGQRYSLEGLRTAIADLLKDWWGTSALPQSGELSLR